MNEREKKVYIFNLSENNITYVRTMLARTEDQIKRIVDLETAQSFVSSKPFTYIRETGAKLYFFRTQDKNYVLGIQEDLVNVVMVGLFKYKCTYVTEEQKGKMIWIKFKCGDLGFLAKLALNFPCPEGREPLVIGGTPSKPILIFGNAAKHAKLAKVQRVENVKTGQTIKTIKAE